MADVTTEASESINFGSFSIELGLQMDYSLRDVVERRDR